MEKKILIDKKKYIFRISAATPRLYRLKFNEDIITGMNKMFAKASQEKEEDHVFSSDEISMLENLCYICHKQGDESQPDDIIEWLEQFSKDAIYDIFGEIIDMWIADNEQLSTAKKKTEDQ